ncbi:MAG: SDR family NAD(P)-dependent oxidoreductase [Anaerolineales bacterium]|nr:SDR family NAD(P)-dependent oxidoreductase [Anaerolineales bacterium]
MKVLITGGAGFVGSHTADLLLKQGYQVRVLDNLDPQVHGEQAEIPTYLDKRIEFQYGDVRDRQKLKTALNGVQAVIHLAAAVGVGQSMYEIYRYVDYNSLGGAMLLNILANEEHTIQKMVVASSMSVYGEGEYRCNQCGPVYPKLRLFEQLEARQWEMLCPHCGALAAPVPTSEAKPLFPTSVYAITKRDHEEMFLTVGQSYRIPTVALRYFNIYGSRQALSNPYTGVAAIFSSRLLNHNPPVVFEDGLQSRDFTHVSDIAQANLLALEKETASYQVFNIGTGRPLTILDAGNILCEQLDPQQKPVVLNQFRAGDIRHCYADIRQAREKLGYAPRVKFEDGIGELVAWVQEQQANDQVAKATEQLTQRKLVR